ncbi:MAG: hypothetical protein GY830_07040 [Bacteroidetes bacterium]|nr:hypothetical protein [Bacteroidota bacterium]
MSFILVFLFSCDKNKKNKSSSGNRSGDAINPLTTLLEGESKEAKRASFNEKSPSEQLKIQDLYNKFVQKNYQKKEYIDNLVVGCGAHCRHNNHQNNTSHTIDIVPSEEPTFSLDIADKDKFKKVILDSEIFTQNGKYQEVILEHLPQTTFIDEVFLNYKKLLKSKGTLKIISLPSYLLKKNGISEFLNWSNKTATNLEILFSGYKFDFNKIMNNDFLTINAPFTLSPKFIDLINKNLKKSDRPDDEAMVVLNTLHGANQVYEEKNNDEKKKLLDRRNTKSKEILKKYFKDLGFNLKEINIESEYILLEVL